jgi:hypothetical protein
MNTGYSFVIGGGSPVIAGGGWEFLIFLVKALNFELHFKCFLNFLIPFFGIVADYGGTCGDYF